MSAIGRGEVPGVLGHELPETGSRQRAQDRLGPEAVVVTIFCEDNKKYLTTDLLRSEPVKLGYWSPDVELIAYEALPRANLLP